MNYSIIISTKAKLNTQDAYDYYEGVGQSLAERFLQMLEDQYEKIKANPQHYSFLSAKKDLRFLVVPQLPVIIIFEVKNDQVFIIDVHNTHKNMATL